ncbi:MAG: FAD-binding oxidoreductase [Deltaproteobacteria bacterium]|nr:FAD-binding oxidoreductase [Deltaproteobacteria bacterium]
MSAGAESDLPGALEAWTRCLGSGSVTTDRDALGALLADTVARVVTVPAALRPRSTEEVRACMRVATAYRVALYPSSRGCNWGLGTRTPPTPGCVLLDLSALDRVRALDPSLGTVTVEPGVTFRALRALLEAEAPGFFLNVTGSSPDASVLGNLLDRGDGAGPYADRALHGCGFEAVLATGELVHTGFARFQGTPLGAVHRWGVGPALDGLLSQGNLAVCTAGTVWLAPKPRALRVLRFTLAEERALPAAVEAVRALRLDGTLRGSCALWNDYRAVSTRARFPRHRGDATTPLTREALRAWVGPVPRWEGTAGLYAQSEAVAAALEAHARSVLGPAVDTLTVVRAEGDPAGLFLTGAPHEESLRSAWWRAPGEPPEEGLDPARARCGVRWVCAAAPLTGEAVGLLVSVAEETLLAYGFEPMLAVVTPQERAAHLVALVLFDRDAPGAEAQALYAQEALQASLATLGALPFRLAVDAPGALPAASDDYDSVLARLKAALDPGGVLAPGRYQRAGR